VNIPTVIPPKAARKGGKPKLTPTQQVELWSWYKAVKFLGTKKQKAREFGISLSSLNGFFARMRDRERSQVEQ
jgi:hypothetical protein